jgi:hypothetical protein
MRQKLDVCKQVVVRSASGDNAGCDLADVELQQDPVVSECYSSRSGYTVQQAPPIRLYPFVSESAWALNAGWSYGTIVDCANKRSRHIGRLEAVVI